MVEGIKKEVEITSSLSKAIANGELKVYYQPKMETGSLRMEGAEALIRWQKPDGRFIYPRLALETAVAGSRLLSFFSIKLIPVQNFSLAAKYSSRNLSSISLLLL